MSNPLAQGHDHLAGSDRRLYYRQPIRTLAYVELDEGNGGIVLNVSEGGLSVQAFASLMDDELPGVRFQLSESEGWIQANARITWTGQSRKLAGLEFVDLSDESRGRIKEWLIREALPAGAVADPVPGPKTDEPLEAPADNREATIATVPAPEPAFAAELPVHNSAPASEMETPMPGAPITDAIAPPTPDAFARILGRAHESEREPSGQTAHAKPISTEKLIANRWAAAFVLVLLAIASLAAGWAAGEGKLGKFLGKFNAMASQKSADNRETASNAAIPAARISEIEVVNASGQRWTIPFNGPLGNSGDAVRRQANTSISSQPTKPLTGFRTWILAPPQQTRTAAAQSGPVAENPPLPADAPAATEGVLTSSGAIDSHTLAAAPPLRLPEPQPTGIVKQGQLIHRVDPDYPEMARQQRAEGVVRLNVTVGTDGIVRGLSLLGGPQLLVSAAESAVRQWRYTPTTLDGKPVEFQREVDLTFHISTPAR
jgi:TonB family protein